MTRLGIAVVAFVCIVILAIALVVIPAPNHVTDPKPVTNTPPVGASEQASIPDLIRVDLPLPGATVLSPMNVSGQARGNWFFEASAPYELKDAGGNVIAQGHVDTLGDWMTTDYVLFNASISFPPQPAGSSGTLVLKNDNPSGDPARDKELDIPVKF